MDILDSFSGLEDPRDSVNQEHNLLDIVFLTLTAMLSGAEGWKQIHQFGLLKKEWLQKYRPFEYGIPSISTISRVIQGLNPEQLMLGFIDFANKIRANKGKPLIAIDGKTLRGSFTEERSSALHMVSAFAVEQGLTLCQKRSTGKKNEINTTESLLDLFDVKGAVITADAMNTQKKIADKIVTLGGDYILQVKDNQKGLLDEIKAYIHKVRRDNCEDISREETVDPGHGRIEERVYERLSVTDWLSKAKNWKNLNSVIEVNRTRHLKDKIEQETSYYISSLPAETKVACYIRGHWSIENSSHHILDVTYREDDSRIRVGDGPENMSTFRRLAMNIAKLHPKKDSMRGKLKEASWSDTFRDELIFGVG